MACKCFKFSPPPFSNLTPFVFVSQFDKPGTPSSTTLNSDEILKHTRLFHAAIVFSGIMSSGSSAQTQGSRYYDCIRQKSNRCESTEEETNSQSTSWSGLCLSQQALAPGKNWNRVKEVKILMNESRHEVGTYCLSNLFTCLPPCQK